MLWKQAIKNLKTGWKHVKTKETIPMILTLTYMICKELNFKIMVYLNYNNLDNDTQNRLLSMSKKDVESRFGEQLKNYAREHYVNYEALLEEEAIRNLYNYKYIFNI